MTSNGTPLWTLYQTVVDEQHRYLDRLQKRVSFYTGLLITLIGASVVALLQAPWILNFILVLAGGVLVSFTAILASKGIFRTYRLFTECISTRAKLERRLELDSSIQPTAESSDDWLSSEPLVAFRHIENRREHASAYCTSRQYEEAMQWRWRTFRGITHATYLVALIIGIALVGSAVALLVVNGPELADALANALGAPPWPSATREWMRIPWANTPLYRSSNGGAYLTRVRCSLWEP